MAGVKKFDLTKLTKNWDVEAPLYRFECLIDIVEKISDGLPEDRTTPNALNSVHEQLCQIHGEFRGRLMLELRD